MSALSKIDTAAKICPLNIRGVLLEFGQLLHEVGIRDAHERPLHAERLRLDDARRLKFAERVDDDRARDLRLVGDARCDQSALELPLAREFLQDRMGCLALGVRECLHCNAYRLALTCLNLAFLRGVTQHLHPHNSCAIFREQEVRIPELFLAACHDEGYDLAIGSRYVTGVNVVNWPIGRVLMSYFASKYVRFVTGFTVHDTTAGFKCYKRRVLQTIELDKIRFKGYGFQIEMKYTAYKIGFRIKEVSVVFVNRREGTSKMSGGIFGEAFFGVMRLRLDGWMRKYPKIEE